MCDNIPDKRHHVKSRVRCKHPTSEDLGGNGEAATEVFINPIKNGESIIYISYWEIGKHRG